MTEVEDRAERAIRARMRELGLTQPRLAKLVGKSPSWTAVQLLPNVEGTVRHFWAKEPESFRRLLRALQWTPEEFYKATGIELPGLREEQILRDHALPVKAHIIPIVDAGAGLPSWTDTGEQIEVVLPEISGYDRRDLFAVRVRGDSMEPTLSEGDIVLFVRDGEPESGKIVAVHMPDDGLIVKRLQRVGDAWLLVSDNPAHPPRELEDGERIFGVAKAVVRRV